VVVGVRLEGSSATQLTPLDSIPIHSSSSRSNLIFESTLIDLTLTQ